MIVAIEQYLPTSIPRVSHASTQGDIMKIIQSQSGSISRSIVLCMLSLLLGSVYAESNPRNQMGIPDSEFNALMDLYAATGGPNWIDNDGWEDAQVTSLSGVSTESGHVVFLLLPQNKLVGVLPDTLDALTKLEYLWLQKNNLSGPVPAAWSDFSVHDTLEVVNLSENQLTGPFPEAFLGISSLQVLDLARNQFSGSIPSTVGGMTQLLDLNLHENAFSGVLPPELGNLQLEQLWIYGNAFQGPLPSTLTNYNAEGFSLWAKYNALSVASGSALEAWLIQAGAPGLGDQIGSPLTVSVARQTGGDVRVNWTLPGFRPTGLVYEIAEVAGPGAAPSAPITELSSAATTTTLENIAGGAGIVMRSRMDPWAENDNTVYSAWTTPVFVEPDAGRRIVITYASSDGPIVGAEVLVDGTQSLFTDASGSVVFLGDDSSDHDFAVISVEAEIEPVSQ